MTTNIDDISTLHLKSFKSIIRVHGGDNWIRKTDLLIPIQSLSTDCYEKKKITRYD